MNNVKIKRRKINKIIKLINDKKFDKALKLSNIDDVKGLYEIGKKFIENKNFVVAEKIFDLVVNLNPKNIDAWNKKGVSLEQLKKHHDAISCYDYAIVKNPEYSKAWSNKGVALGNLGKHDEELKCYNKALEINPRNANAWYNKGVMFGELGKIDKELKCYDKAIEINSKESKVWYNKGVALGNIGKYNEELECYNAAIKLNSGESNAWDNKGMLLVNLEKYDEAVNCFDEVLKINPHDFEALNKKGVALGFLEKHDEAVKCFNETIKINQSYAESYGNKGIAFLYTRKYKDAITEFKKARKLFSKKKDDNNTNNVNKLELSAKNALQLITSMTKLDNLFIACLYSMSLTKLKRKCSKICEGVTNLLEKYEKKDIPKEVIELLVSKANCFKVLLEALNLTDIEFTKLVSAQKVFKKWNLITLDFAADAINIFIRKLSEYNQIKDIPKKLEGPLLSVLRGTYVLNGNLTDEICDKMIGDSLTTKPFSGNKKLKIRYINIPSIKKGSIRVCLVQLDFSLTEIFPYKLKNKNEVKGKILKALEVAKENKVNIICFPELSFDIDFIKDVKKYKDMIIIGGSYYYNSYNVCPIIVSGKKYLVYKINPSPHFEIELELGKGMKTGEDIKIFGTKDGVFKFGVLICIDFLREGKILYDYKDEFNKGLNFIFNPSFNPETKRFQRNANSDCENYYVDIIQVNAKEHGGSCIIGVEHKNVIKRLASEGYREKDDVTYKLCEAKGEMIIIADISLIALKVPTPLRESPRLKIVERYNYIKKRWKKQKK